MVAEAVPQKSWADASLDERRQMTEASARRFAAVLVKRPDDTVWRTARWVVLELVKLGHSLDAAEWAVHLEIQAGHLESKHRYAGEPQ